MAKWIGIAHILDGEVFWMAPPRNLTNNPEFLSSKTYQIWLTLDRQAPGSDGSTWHIVEHEE